MFGSLRIKHPILPKMFRFGRAFDSVVAHRHRVFHSAASLALLLFRGLPSAFFSTGARNFPV